MIELFLDTTSNKEIIVRLTIDKNIFEEKIAIQNNRTQIVLPTIEKLLRENDMNVHKIEKVVINPGPGSFTGVRVGSSIANSIIFSLGLSQKLVEGKYI